MKSLYFDSWEYGGSKAMSTKRYSTKEFVIKNQLIYLWCYQGVYKAFLMEKSLQINTRCLNSSKIIWGLMFIDNKKKLTIYPCSSQVLAAFVFKDVNIFERK